MEVKLHNMNLTLKKIYCFILYNQLTYIENINTRQEDITVYDNNFTRPEANLFLHRTAMDMGASFTALQIRITQLGLYVKKPLDEYISEIGL